MSYPCHIDYQPAADSLKGRVILITGAGDGIGRSVAVAAAKHGATVILTGRTVSKLEATYDLITKAGAPQPAIHPLDLASATLADYQAFAAAINQEYGQLDGLLHNAGILGTRTPLAEYDPAEWQLVLQTNLNAGFLLTQACLPLLKQSPDASLIFTSSGVGRKGRAYWGAYAVSKFATEGLMQVWADELENTSTIRVNSINPGPTRTRMRLKAYPGEDRDLLKTPDEIIGTYLYLLGSDSKDITGQQFDAQ